MIAHEIRECILRVDHVSLALAGKPVLRDVNLEVRDIYRPGYVTGQVVGLLGPSGIGKTRLFRLLAGIDRPDAGAVLVGEPPQPVARGMVGVVAQNYPLFAHRTVLGNLLVAGWSVGLGGDEAGGKAGGFLQRFGIQHKAGHYPSQLSGGERQRVAIAQQFMCSERFLLMDEPFSGLDLVAIAEVRKLIAEVASLNELNTILVVTHDIVSALETADTIWLLGRDRDAEGRLIPGARIQATYDLAQRDVAWRKDAAATTEFFEVLKEIRERFPSL